MEPRQMWERHAVLAEAFCGVDEQVRRTRAVLDEAEAERSQTLAAFAVTVGDDDAVAQMLGLTEREVRLARRAVGRDAARARADELLSAERDTAVPQEARPAAPRAGAEAGTPGPGAGLGPGAGPGPRPVAPPAAGAPWHQQWTAAGAPNRASAPAPSADRRPRWSPPMDAVLAGAWQTGLDLTVLAAELGVDLGLLTVRAQQLSAEGRLPGPASAGEQPGRHRAAADSAASRRHDSHGAPPAGPHAAPSPARGEGGPEGGPYRPHHPWQQQQQQHQQQQPGGPFRAPDTTTGDAHDWDGILNQWQSDRPLV